MPDFLTRLAARALGTLPVAEPLVPTRFDPGVQRAVLTPFERVTDPTGTSKTIGESTNHAFPHQADVTPAQRSLVQPDPPSEDFDAAYLIRSQQHRHVSRMHNLQQESRNGPPDAQGDHRATSTSPLPSSMSEAKDTVPRSTRERRLSALPLFAEPRPAPTDTISEQARVTGQHEQQSMSAPHAAPPMIRVNIGRIEVRAELPERAPAPAPQRARSSHVSLEQFLKQAGGGAR